MLSKQQDTEAARITLQTGGRSLSAVQFFENRVAGWQRDPDDLKLRANQGPAAPNQQQPFGALLFAQRSRSLPSIIADAHPGVAKLQNKNNLP